MNKTSKSKKNDNAWREGKLQMLENVGNGYHQPNGDERKNKKRVPKTKWKTSRSQALQEKSYQ